MTPLSSTGANSPLDFRVLFESAPGLYLVLSPDFTIVAASNAYLQATKTERKAILGRSIFEVFPAATGFNNLRTSLNNVLQNRKPDAMAVQQYDIRRPDSEGGGFEARFWNSINSPVIGPDGAVTHIIHHVSDQSDGGSRAQARLEQELADTQLLQRLSAEMASPRDTHALYDKIVDAATKIMRSDFASMQMYFPERGKNGELRLLAFRGFDPEAAKFWEWVRADSGCTCGEALRTGKPGIATNVATCAFMAGTPDREAYLQAGMHAAQSTPLLSRDGKLLGMLSTHWRRPHEPAERDWGIFNVLARHAADLIERRQAEQALRTARDYAEATLRTSPVPLLVLESNLRVVTANEAFYKCFNVRSDQTEGRLVYELGNRQWDIPRLRELLEDILPKKSLFEQFEVTHEFESVGQRTMLLNARRMAVEHGGPERIILVIEDITERKRSEKALRQSEERFRILADSSSVLMWRTDHTGVAFVNRHYLSFFGRPYETIAGMGWAKFLHPDDAAAYVETYRSAYERQAGYTFQCRFLRHDGEYRWLQNVGAPHRDIDGAFLGFVGCSTDVTEIKKAEQHLRDADRRKDEFLAVVSHELRTPLTAMLGWINLLTEGQLPPEKVAHGLKVIERNVRVQTQLIEDLLDVSRIVAGKLLLKPQLIDLKSVVEAAIESVRPALEARALVLETSLESTPFLGDTDRLQQVVWNLLSNAVKFTPKGGRIWIQSGRVGSQARIVVRDNGRGIDAKFLPLIFNRFEQQDVSTTRRFGGLGLGLAIVRHLVELHGGTIAVSSAGEGTGAAFTIELPMRVSADSSERQRAGPGSASNRIERLDGMRILVVDDEVDTRELLEMVLQANGAEPIVAANAWDALDRFKEYEPHVVLSDIGMPLEDGCSLIRKIRALPDEQGRNTPAIAVTAFARDENRETALEAGFNAYIPKPIEPKELISIIAAVARGSFAARN